MIEGAVLLINLAGLVYLWRRLRKVEASIPPPDERKQWEAAVRKLLGP